MTNAFKLGTFSPFPGMSFAGVVLEDRVISVDALLRSGPAARTVDDLLMDWDHNFERLCKAVDALGSGGDHDAARPLASLKVMAPLSRPTKLLNSAGNYPAHAEEMVKANVKVNIKAREYEAKAIGRKTAPYMFLEAPDSLCGAFDDVLVPPECSDIDWEVELALAIGRTTHRVPVSKAMDYVAGFMTNNDISARGNLWRSEWPTVGNDWFQGKSHNNFTPSGPFFVPKAFVKDHKALRLTLDVNGVRKQDGIVGEMIFSPEEQISYASMHIDLRPGDIISTGTVGGVGHGTGEYLKHGDIVEAEVEGLGRQHNRVVFVKPDGE